MRTAPTDLSSVAWRRSSYSNGQGGDCVEVQDGAAGAVPVRDSKRPDGPVLRFPDVAWSAFVHGLRSAELRVRDV